MTGNNDVTVVIPCCDGILQTVVSGRVMKTRCCAAGDVAVTIVLDI